MATTAAIEARVGALLRKGTRPLAIYGPSGAGKTSLLRRVAAIGAAQWCTASDLIDGAVEAMRARRYAAFTDSLARDQRPLVIEHLEDLRGKPRTRHEIEHALLLRAAGRRATFLTLTTGRGTSEIRRWLSGWTEVVSLGARPHSSSPTTRSSPPGAV